MGLWLLFVRDVYCLLPMVGSDSNHFFLVSSLETLNVVENMKLFVYLSLSLRSLGTAVQRFSRHHGL